MATQMQQSTHSVREALNGNNGIEKIKGQISNTKTLKIHSGPGKVRARGKPRRRIKSRSNGIGNSGLWV